ncbi:MULTISPECIES: hypothetical protein [Dehalobacter]|uniref:hypothetical protein n=1 Tax=Dehalobacter TaxID=56112 RepID=UPI002589BC24|nr:hypothetical protein [Dehalobacter sp.]MDJ0305401.1 hypothetical protein [Dehalobacter sp.]
MRYDIIVEVKEKSCEATTKVYDDNEVLVSQGVIEIGTTDAVVARQYTEDIFLPDLRKNFPEISALVLPIDSMPEPTPEEGGQ